MKNPTQYELATIAATQTGTPVQRAAAALDLWKACGAALEREADLQASIDADHAKYDEISAMFAGRETITIEEFLREVMPQSKTEDRMRKFREWIRRTIAFHDKLAGAELERTAEAAIKRDRENGIPFVNACAMAEMFTKFLDVDRREKKTARAKKGAAAKKSLGTVSKAAKTPQATRRPRQVKR